MLQKNVHSIEDQFLSFKEGNEEGFAYFFNLHFAPLTWVAQSILKKNEVAEDVVEDSFVKLWERRDLIANSTALKAYLYTTVRNACIDLIRKERSKALYIKEANFTLEKNDVSVIHKIIEAETFNVISSAMESLPTECGRIFRMYYVEGKALKEIANELKLSISTVKTQKGRALLLLKKKLFRKSF